MNATWITFVGSIVVAVISSGTTWGLISQFVTRRQRRDDELQKKQELKEKQEKERREAEHQAERDRNLLSQVQLTAQRSALESEASRYGKLEADNAKILKRLGDVHDAAWIALELLEEFLSKMRPAVNGNETTHYTIMLNLEELGTVRRTINAARQKLR